LTFAFTVDVYLGRLRRREIDGERRACAVGQE
jgi:hypothetical protein